MPEQPLFSWIHVSDIHAGHGDEDVRVDQDLVMKALLRDVERALPKLGVDAIMMTGDIAFRGATSDYDRAKVWLDGLRSITEVEASSTFVVPGNHDVDRSVVQGNAEFSNALYQTRRGERSITDLTRDHRALLEQRTRAYRDFVAQHAPSCVPTDPDSAGWAHEVPLADGLWLRLVGVDTALLSQDDHDEGQLRIGRSQLRSVIGDPARDALRVTLAHHPAGWLADPVEDRHRLLSWSDVLLHGHIHVQGGIQTFEGGNDRALRVVAGAAHSDPGEPPRHGYQFMSLVRSGDRLSLRIWPRTWDKDKGSFVAQGDYAQDVQGYAEFGLRSVKPRKASLPRAGAGDERFAHGEATRSKSLKGRAPKEARRRPRPIETPRTVPEFVPPLCVYLAWHPSSPEGGRLARTLFDALRTGATTEAIGVPTFFRSSPGAGRAAPIDVPLNAADNTAIIVLVDEWIRDDDDWLDWLAAHVDACNDSRGARVYPVWLDGTAKEVVELTMQAIRATDVIPAERDAFVSRRVLHLLWRHLSAQGEDTGAAPPPVQVFVSHAKADGETIAEQIGAFLREPIQQLDTWFDVHNIADGHAFAEQIDAGVMDERSVLLAVQTDAYWGRPWCVREYLGALENQRPIVVVDASAYSGQRPGTWLGRAPILRWNGPTPDFFRVLLHTVLVEALRFAFLPKQLEAIARTFRLEGLTAARPSAPTSYDLFAPPETRRILYPDPELPPAERAVLDRLAKSRGMTLHTPATLLIRR